MFDFLFRIIGLPRWKSIEVKLDTNANPPVLVGRDVNVSNRRVKWSRADSTFEFMDKSMSDLDTGKFPSPKVDAHLITCRNKFKKNDMSEYTIWVKASDKEYSSTTEVLGDPGGEKPVIRN
ncbi:MAG: hypothetical protein HKO64_06010 [Xanthomonadales bacterium]|nr:hypothetical protein [Xanthomonadales bacterium]NNL95158.1 hypothetical protein [Xanthomonadales bacterium]